MTQEQLNFKLKSKFFVQYEHFNKNSVLILLKQLKQKVRANATNSAGTAYGDQVSFTTTVPQNAAGKALSPAI